MAATKKKITSMTTAELRAEVARLERRITKLQEQGDDPKIRAQAAAKRQRRADKAELDFKMGLGSNVKAGSHHIDGNRLVLGARRKGG